MPVFHWQEEDPADVRARALRALLQLLAPAALLLALAGWRLRRYRVV